MPKIKSRFDMLLLLSSNQLTLHKYCKPNSLMRTTTVENKTCFASW